MGAASTEPSDKAVLRSAMRARRKAIGLEAAGAAAQRASALLAGIALDGVETAAVYIAHGSEMDALPVGQVLADRGVTLCLPVVEFAGHRLAFRRWAPGDAMKPDAVGILGPRDDAVRCTPDLVIAPLLAFDRQGRRLGQGGGYYDRTLEGLRADGRVHVVGLAFAEQEVESLTDEAHDQRLDAVLTDREWITVR